MSNRSTLAKKAVIFHSNLKNDLKRNLKNSLQNSLQEGGADLNDIYKERMVIGGRIKKSLLEFLHNKKLQTKRQHNYIRKLGSRKRK